MRALAYDRKTCKPSLPVSVSQFEKKNTTSDFVLKTTYHSDGLLQNHQLREGLGIARVQVNHLTQLLEGIIDLANS